MPKTATERSRLYRKKLQEGSSDKYEDYKKKDRERKKKARKEKKLSAGEQVKEREKCRERVRLHRKRKTEENLHWNSQASVQTSKDPPYKTPQSFGKAIHKVKKALPKSPRKKKAVLHKLASTVDLDSSETIESPTVSSNRKLPADLITKVQQFFLREILSPDKHQEFAIMSLCGGRARRSSSRRDTW